MLWRKIYDFEDKQPAFQGSRSQQLLCSHSSGLRGLRNAGPFYRWGTKSWPASWCFLHRSCIRASPALSKICGRIHSLMRGINLSTCIPQRFVKMPLQIIALYGSFVALQKRTLKDGWITSVFTFHKSLQFLAVSYSVPSSQDGHSNKDMNQIDFSIPVLLEYSCCEASRHKEQHGVVIERLTDQFSSTVSGAVS
jgi:hypothetical protein